MVGRATKMKKSKIRPTEWLTMFLALFLVAGLTLSNLRKSQRTQRDLNRLGDIESIRTALHVYYKKHDRFPAATPDGRILACGWQGEAICEWGVVWEDERFIYTEKLPIDGLAVRGENWPPYFYEQRADGREYILMATIENNSQPEINDSHERCPGDWRENQYLECR